MTAPHAIRYEQRAARLAEEYGSAYFGHAMRCLLRTNGKPPRGRVFEGVDPWAIVREADPTLCRWLESLRGDPTRWSTLRHDVTNARTEAARKLRRRVNDHNTPLRAEVEDAFDPDLVVYTPTIPAGTEPLQRVVFGDHVFAWLLDEERGTGTRGLWVQRMADARRAAKLARELAAAAAAKKAESEPADGTARSGSPALKP